MKDARPYGLASYNLQPSSTYPSECPGISVGSNDPLTESVARRAGPQQETHLQDYSDDLARSDVAGGRGGGHVEW